MINNNRQQNGRRRGRGGQRQGGGGGQGGRDNGSRIDNRSRGNAAQLLEKYKSLAADAQRQGDRVNTEYYLQFADHYFRVVSEQRGRFEEQNQQPRRQQEGFEDGDDGDEEYGFEGERVRADQYQPRGDQQQGREDRNERRERGDDEQRGERPREGGRRERSARYENEGERGQPTLTPHDPATAMASTERGADEEVAPRRRGRPPRTLSEVQEPATHDADRLPPSFAPANDGGDAPTGEDVSGENRPRRRRLRPAGEASQAS